MNRGLVVGVVVGCGLLASAHEAKAGGVLSVDAHAAALFPSSYGTFDNNSRRARALLGITAYGGYAINLPKVYIMPELGLTFDGMPAGNFAPEYYGFRGTAGARVGIKLRIEPSAYAHIGGEILAPGHFASGSARGALAFDAGLGADYRPVRWFTIGLTAGYQGFFGNRTVGKINGIEIAPRIAFWF